MSESVVVGAIAVAKDDGEARAPEKASPQGAKPAVKIGVAGTMSSSRGYGDTAGAKPGDGVDTHGHSGAQAVVDAYNMSVSGS